MDDLRRPWFDYTALSPEAVEAGTADVIARCDAALAAIEAVPADARTVANTLGALDDVGSWLGESDGTLAFIAYVGGDDDLREAGHAAQERLDTYGTGIGFRPGLYRAVQEVADQADGGVEARLLEFTLRDFRRNGMDLDEDSRARVKALKERLVELGVAFRRNIDEYDDGIDVTRSQLAGLPDAYVDGLTAAAQDEHGEKRYRVSLDYPDLHPFLDSASDADLRRELFLKSYHRGGEDNVAILEEAVAIRAEIAGVLGYESWAAYQLETKMAGEPGRVRAFVDDLVAKVTPKADADRAALAEVLGVEAEIWDWRYATQRVLMERHEVDAFAVAQYFPLDAVIDGMFDLYQRLVGARFVHVDDALAWHDDVGLYLIEDAASGDTLAHFYLDLHPRPGKFGHAAAFTLRPGRRLADGGYQLPVSAMVANFTKPTASSPSLLRHTEVVTLFHEFGHVLHQTLTTAPYARFSGTSVERDFVEAPSQMLEHWCWEADVLAGFARHHETGETIPADLVQRMVAAKNVSSGISALRQLYFGSLDLAYHSVGPDDAAVDTDAVAAALHPITGFRFPDGTHFQAGFGHLFGYDAGYYGYMWSKVFGDDMYTRFERGDVEAVGRDYRTIVLERGGTVDGAEIVREFLGRDPDTAAFLRDLGLT